MGTFAVVALALRCFKVFLTEETIFFFDAERLTKVFETDVRVETLGLLVLVRDTTVRFCDERFVVTSFRGCCETTVLLSLRVRPLA